MTRNHYQKTPSSLPQRSDSGLVLMLVLVMIPILALIGIYLYRSVQFQSQLARESHRHQQAMAVAEAGVERAILRLNDFLLTSNRWYSDGTPPVTFPGVLTNRQGRQVGEYRVTIIEPTSKRPTVVSRSFIPNASNPQAIRIVQVTTELPGPTVDWGLFAYNSLEFDQFFEMDSYDSTEAPYDPDNPGGNGDIGGGDLADAYFDKSTIHGDIQVGGTVTYGGSLEVDGYIAEGEPGIPPPPFPDQVLEDTKDDNNNDQVLVDGELFTGGTELITDQDAIVEFPAGKYFFTKIDLGQRSEIRVLADPTDPDSKAEIYVEAPSSTDVAVQFSQDVNVNIVNVDPYADEPPSPNNFWLYVKQGEVQIDQAGTTYGVIFAPNSTVQIDQDNGYYGAVVGGDVHIDAGNPETGGGFHYDESLGSGPPEVKGTLVTSWTEVLPNNGGTSGPSAATATF